MNPNKLVRKVLCSLVLGILVISYATPILADVLNPEWFEKQCNEGEIEVVCSYSSSTPFGPRTKDECKKYENHPDYSYLTGHGSSFGGEEKYCLAEGADGLSNTEVAVYSLFDNYIALGAVIVLISGVSIFVLWKIGRKHDRK